MNIPIVETERLRLRAFRDEDLDAWAAICSDAEVMRYLSGNRPLSRIDAWRQMALFIGHWQLKGFGIWAIEEKSSGRLIGRTGLFEPEGWPGFELGWVLGRNWWGKGYASEGAKAGLRFAFETLGRDHVVSYIHPDNTNSIRVAERIGEALEGEADLNGMRVLVYGVARPIP